MNFFSLMSLPHQDLPWNGSHLGTIPKSAIIAEQSFNGKHYIQFRYPMSHLSRLLDEDSGNPPMTTAPDSSASEKTYPMPSTVPTPTIFTGVDGLGFNMNNIPPYSSQVQVPLTDSLLVLAQIHHIGTIEPCVCDELKEVFGIEKNGTHSLVLKARKNIAIITRPRIRLHNDSFYFVDDMTTIDLGMDDPRCTDYLSYQVRIVLLFREVMGLVTKSNHIIFITQPNTSKSKRDYSHASDDGSSNQNLQRDYETCSTTSSSTLVGTNYCTAQIEAPPSLSENVLRRAKVHSRKGRTKIVPLSIMENHPMAKVGHNLIPVKLKERWLGRGVQHYTNLDVFSLPEIASRLFGYDGSNMNEVIYKLRNDCERIIKRVDPQMLHLVDYIIYRVKNILASDERFDVVDNINDASYTFDDIFDG